MKRGSTIAMYVSAISFGCALLSLPVSFVLPERHLGYTFFVIWCLAMIGGLSGRVPRDKQWKFANRYIPLPLKIIHITLLSISVVGPIATDKASSAFVAAFMSNIAIALTFISTKYWQLQRQGIDLSEFEGPRFTFKGNTPKSRFETLNKEQQEKYLDSIRDQLHK